MAASTEDIKLFKKKFAAWRLDWNLFAREALKIRLDPKQSEILESIQNNRRVSVCSGTARGKDFLAATASICFLYLTPYWDENGIFHSSTVINTGPTDRQVKNIMMREIRSRYNGSILPKLSQFGFNSGRLWSEGIKFDLPPTLKGDPAYANIEKWYMLAFKGDDNNTEAWTGFHNTNIMIAATEASGLGNVLFSGIEGCLQGNSKLLIVHNPNVSYGEAYNSMRDPQYKSFRLSSLDSPNVLLGSQLDKGEITDEQYRQQMIPGQVDYVWVKEHIEKPGWTLRINSNEFDASKHDFEFDGNLYRPSDVCRIKILGIHPESSEDTLIPLSWIEAAQDRWIDATRPNGKSIRAVDVAGMGSDTTVFVDRIGDYVDPIRTVPFVDSNTVHMEIAGKIVIDIENLESVYVDTIGEGAGVFSRLREQHIMNVYNFKNSFGANGLKDKTEARKFLNMRSYTHWAMRDWLDPRYGSTAMLPPDDELKAQLTEIKYKVRSDGVIQIEEKDEIKKRLGVSPDKSDGLAMTFAPKERLIQGIKVAPPRPRPGMFG